MMKVTTSPVSVHLLVCYDRHHSLVGEDSTTAELVVVYTKRNAEIIDAVAEVVIKLLRYFVS